MCQACGPAGVQHVSDVLPAYKLSPALAAIADFVEQHPPSQLQSAMQAPPAYAASHFPFHQPRHALHMVGFLRTRSPRLGANSDSCHSPLTAGVASEAMNGSLAAMWSQQTTAVMGGAASTRDSTSAEGANAAKAQDLAGAAQEPTSSAAYRAESALLTAQQDAEGDNPQPHIILDVFLPVSLSTSPDDASASADEVVGKLSAADSELQGTPDQVSDQAFDPAAAAVADWSEVVQQLCQRGACTLTATSRQRLQASVPAADLQVTLFAHSGAAHSACMHIILGVQSSNALTYKVHLQSPLDCHRATAELGKPILRCCASGARMPGVDTLAPQVDDLAGTSSTLSTA